MVRNDDIDGLSGVEDLDAMPIEVFLRRKGMSVIRIDGKYSCDGEKIYNPQTGAVVPPEEPLFVLRAKDLLAMPVIELYRVMCEVNRCSMYGSYSRGG